MESGFRLLAANSGHRHKRLSLPVLKSASHFSFGQYQGDKAFAKLNDFFGEDQVVLTENERTLLSELQSLLKEVDYRKRLMNHPLAACILMEKLYGSLKPGHRFPLLDILRMLILNKQISAIFAGQMGILPVQVIRTKVATYGS